MHDNIDRLNETFAAHEHLVPDADVILHKASIRARSYRRRRRAARATGASVLGAGIVAGGVALPGLKWGSSQPATGTLPASGNALPIISGTPTPSPSPRTYTQQQELTEYFADGYNYDDAVTLAALWNETDITKVKADAGLKLLQGSTLPVSPSGTPEPAQQKAQEQAMDAFFAAGYSYDDAVTLSNLWHESDVGQVKIDAGQKLLAGQSLPIEPAPSTPDAGPAGSPPPAVSTALDQQALNAYFAAGYDYDDAVALGKLWHQTDVGQIKAAAGAKLLAGQTLPIAP